VTSTGQVAPRPTHDGEAALRVGAARLRACADHPYLASALYSLAIVIAPEAPTEPGVAVDRSWRCYVAPEVALHAPIEDLSTRLLHAVSHLVRDHANRRVEEGAAAGAELVNLAQDCEINDDLAADHLALPPGAPLPHHFGWEPGLPFEAYLAEARGLALATGEVGQVGDDDGDAGDGAEEDGGDGGRGGDGGGADDRGVDCGPGAHGEDRAWAVDDGEAPVSPTEGDLIRRRVANAVREHDRFAGTVPAGWRRWAESLLDPVVDWRAVLSGTVRATLATASGAVDYTYRHPSRRTSVAGGVVLPALRRPAPAVAVVIDTSGSMGADALGQALAEVQGVLDHAGARRDALRVLCCDAAVAWAGRVTNVESIPLAGGGGTDLGRGLEEALAGRPRPDVVVVLTDGQTDWPTAPPAVPVVVGLVGGSGQRPPEWATTVAVSGAGPRPLA
jgi:predicted metal-dependent peptidase